MLRLCPHSTLFIIAILNNLHPVWFVDIQERASTYIFKRLVFFQTCEEDILEIGLYGYYLPMCQYCISCLHILPHQHLMMYYSAWQYIGLCTINILLANLILYCNRSVSAGISDQCCASVGFHKDIVQLHFHRWIWHLLPLHKVLFWIKIYVTVHIISLL